jgi:hypothetical protein
MADIEVSSRGVLISHPREDYALLEERLLESLELEPPRIRHNHYFQTSGSTEDDAEQDDCDSSDTKCPDCGRRIRAEELDRKWEIKVFAANGLMRAGAWAAAWQEMEKVDIEVNIWLPEDVRQDLEAKLALLELPAAEPDTQEQPWVESDAAGLRHREVYGDHGISTRQMPAEDAREQTKVHQERTDLPVSSGNNGQRPRHEEHAIIRQLSGDVRNILLGILSALVLYFAVMGQKQPATSKGGASPAGMSAFTAEASISTVTTTSIAISTSIVTVSHTPSTFTSSSAVETDRTHSLVLQSVSTESAEDTTSTIRIDDPDDSVEETPIAGLPDDWRLRWWHQCHAPRFTLADNFTFSDTQSVCPFPSNLLVVIVFFD